MTEYALTLAIEIPSGTPGVRDPNGELLWFPIPGTTGQVAVSRAQALTLGIVEPVSEAVG